MSRYSFSETCANCGEQADVLEDSREGSFRWCAYCGLTEEPRRYQCSLEDLNERREQMTESGIHPDDTALEPLEKLPEWRLT